MKPRSCVEVTDVTEDHYASIGRIKVTVSHPKKKRPT